MLLTIFITTCNYIIITLFILAAAIGIVKSAECISAIYHYPLCMFDKVVMFLFFTATAMMSFMIGTNFTAGVF